jgi:hypothetical protein
VGSRYTWGWDWKGAEEKHLENYKFLSTAFHHILIVQIEHIPLRPGPGARKGSGIQAK